ncbi:MAG: HlyD family efflux transporter periplasmic adaptor subunit [Desmonostoc geniculatum HA4340-LM1]|jgi:HlyD family secretion protein|nr:HlyD family efflux transporter periplasmic adaptor subunit [Desmonostoc geniculatum HA4340-LM1]
MAQTAPKIKNSLVDAPMLPSKQQRRFVPKPLLFVAVLAFAGIIGYLVKYLQPQPKADAIRVNGRIEGYETEIGVKRSGRIEWIEVREGTAVKKGQKLIRLDDSNDQLLQQQLRAAEAQLASIKSDEQQKISDVERVKSEIEQVSSEIREAQLNLQQSRGDTQGRIDQARSNVAASKAQLAQAQAQAKQAAAEVKLAKTNRDRYAQLVAEGAINQQQFDQAQTVLDTALATSEAQQAAVNAAREQLKAVEGGLTQTQTTVFNPSIRNAQLEALIRKRDQSYAQLRSALAVVKSTQAKINDSQAARQQILTQIQDSKKDLNVVSPLNGVVTARSVELGTVVDNQTKILTVVDPGTVYLRGFIPVGDIGKVRLGQLAKIFLDSAPNSPLKGKVIAIDPQASFTPENIYFQKDRVKQVVGIRISVENPSGCFNPDQPYAGTDLPCAKIGMPGDAEIMLRDQGKSS